MSWTPSNGSRETSGQTPKAKWVKGRQGRHDERLRSVVTAEMSTASLKRAELAFSGDGAQYRAQTR